MPSTTAPAARSTDRTRPGSRPQTPAPTRWAPVADRAVADPATSVPARTRVVAYLRVSTQEQAASGLGLDAQRACISDEAARRGWEVDWCVDEGVSGTVRNRPGLARALDLLRTRQATALVVAKMDRLARSVVQASDLLETARKQRWSVLILDLGMDLSTPHGKAMAQMLAVFAELEREMIAARTKDALQAAKARGQRLGRPRATPPEVVARVVALSADLSPLQVARALTAECVPTTRSAPAWRASTVRRLLNGVALDAEAAAARAAVAAR